MKKYPLAGKNLFLLLIFLMACCQFAAAQKNKVDSLQKAYQKNKQDTTLVELLQEKATKVYLTSNTDSGMLCMKQSLALSRKIHYKNGEVRALAGIATYLNIQGDLPGTLRQTFAVLPQAIQIKDYNVIVQCYNNIGLTYNILKDYKKAKENYKKAMVIAEKAHLYDLALIEYNNVARSFVDNDELDSALFYTQKAYNLALKSNNNHNLGYLIRNFGIIQFKRGHYAHAIDFYNKSIKSIPGNNNHYLLSEDYRRIAEAYQHLNKVDSCIDFAKKAFEQAKLARNPDQVQLVTKLLADVFLSKSDFKQAFDYQQIMIKAKDSLFSQQKTLQVQNLAFNEEQRKHEQEAAAIAYQNRIRLYAVVGILGVFVLIASILLYANQKRKKANSLLKQQNEQIQTQHKALKKTLAELKTTQTQLIQSEKMASLGELTAGIAHEIQNPLNFVNNFSEVNTELIDEMEQEIGKGNFEDVKTIAADIKDNQQKINLHGKRADFIVKGMLQHSRNSTGERQLTNINVLADEFLKLSYHGLRAKDKSFNAEMITHFDENLSKVNVVQQDIGRVLLNLFNNAFYAVNQKSKTLGEDYKPAVKVTTSTENGQVIIKVKDNGIGIPDAIKEKVLQPFFTTKPTGEGTGLGLSLSYDILIKGHNGTLDIVSKEREGAEFIISLPSN
ncbi:tetratricopeptide repeat-containing sensor histidine kinase [Mucilaginibacter sp. McL0603]|uniref:tetratricopeptide repeat-containing sensor histidine kinase n=1 Tax=Mucilaginibacter sp. McL0603 TaxID=3415670 RepID=UPI003CEB1831